MDDYDDDYDDDEQPTSSADPTAVVHTADPTAHSADGGLGAVPVAADDEPPVPSGARFHLELGTGILNFTSIFGSRVPQSASDAA